MIRATRFTRRIYSAITVICFLSLSLIMLGLTKLNKLWLQFKLEVVVALTAILCSFLSCFITCKFSSFLHHLRASSVKKKLKKRYHCDVFWFKVN
ncbi:hypothetical protein BCV72DRAFT_29486 [Rhizopus microsporus var. microsporus]|uniref:Uncharacterized protein n=2 Tax=Rhizopus microsporus TaxID=58291 RepID=A0A2G4SM07_RHIZD|nr:uncharacterized protein RHIMIDRAFT_46468 [Rhizopus microsporus ATCC 52813]ORE03570.1 hypothetical protein BCV72DRAFT_29486 [Rhizopus microsporus var. microsporus]PHZ09804.1 hypothetical protein RHIMIDRAFT_46468 [Rhizopus microsporus ATCC 52813]